MIRQEAGDKDQKTRDKARQGEEQGPSSMVYVNIIYLYLAGRIARSKAKYANAELVSFVKILFQRDRQSESAIWQILNKIH